jgi:3-ketoacyl-CoA synthase
MVSLGPLVLPFTEKFLFAVNLLKRKFSGKGKVAPYTPDFSLAFDHICIHSGEYIVHIISVVSGALPL